MLWCALGLRSLLRPRWHERRGAVHHTGRTGNRTDDGSFPDVPGLDRPPLGSNQRDRVSRIARKTASHEADSLQPVTCRVFANFCRGQHPAIREASIEGQALCGVELPLVASRLQMFWAVE